MMGVVVMKRLENLRLLCTAWIVRNAVLVALAVMAPSRLSLAQERPPTLGELVDALRLKHDEHQNLTLEVLEEIQEDGKSVRHERMLLLTDLQSRVNLREEVGRLNAAGEFEAELRTQKISDGEKSVEIDFNFHSLRGFRQKDGQKVYVVVQPADRVVPFRRWEPVCGPRSQFVNYAKEAMDKGWPVTIERGRASQGNGWKVRFEYRGSPVAFEVDPARRIVVEATTYRPQSEVAAVQFVGNPREWSPGFWLPVSGTFRFAAYELATKDSQGKPVVKQIPDRVRTFKVLRAVYDDPDFPADAFEIKLKPGWIVRDQRKKAEYKVGGKELINEEIETAVAEAKKEMARPEYKTPVQEAMEEAMAEQTRERVEPAKNRLTEYLIYANVAGLILIVSIVAWRRLRRRP